MSEHTTLGAAGRARFVLGTAARNLERAIASPVHDRELWGKQVAQDLDTLREALTEHVDITEGDNGLLAQIMEDAPRLASAIDVILADHAELCEAVDQIQDTLDHTPDQTHDIRAGIIDALARLTAHRHRGADLVFDAYNVDIGGLSGE
jgi:hypothetical protein